MGVSKNIGVSRSTKVFCVGMNKTGTSSILRCLRILGVAPIAIRAKIATELSVATEALLNSADYEPALKIAENFRAFEDRPWNMWEMYMHLDKRFADSLFVLSIRDSESWWRSVENWIRVEKPHLIKVYLAHLRIDTWDKKEAIAAYEKQNLAIQNYFKDSGRLLLYDLNAGDGWEPLCRFLGVEVPSKELPHLNAQDYSNQ